MTSILAADFGSVHTRIVLLDLVDGSYRLTARAIENTTASFPFNDIAVGLAHGLEEIRAVTGKRITGDDGQLMMPERADRAGVDDFVATASAGRPLRAMLVGLVPEISIASGLRAASGTYVEIVETLSLNDARSQEEKLNAVVRSNPDMILVTGGTEQGAQAPVLELVEVVHQALKLLERPRRPVILYAGNSALVPQIRALFQDLTKLFVAPNVRPSLEKEDLDGTQLQLGMAYDEFKDRRGSGFGAVGDMSRMGILPTAQGYNLMVEYLGRTRSDSVLAVDVGSAVSSLSAFVGGEVHTTIRTDLGLGHSAYNALETLGADRVARWLPFYPQPHEITTYARNKTLRPGSIPQTVRDSYLEYALLRASIEELLIASRPVWYKSAHLPGYMRLPECEPIIGAGAALTQTGNGGLSAMLLLDALQPEGITTLETDPYGLLPVLGALAYFRPDTVVQVLETTGLERLGTAFSVGGYPRAERPALRVRVTTADETVEQDILGGHLWVYPLAIGQRAEVDIRVVARGVDIAGKRRIRQTVEGGAAGIIFDARGRPLPLGLTVPERAPQLLSWLREAAGIPLQAVPDDWLQEPTSTQTSARKGRRLRQLGKLDIRDDEPDLEAILGTADKDRETDNIRDVLS